MITTVCEFDGTQVRLQDGVPAGVLSVQRERFVRSAFVARWLVPLRALRRARAFTVGALLGSALWLPMFTTLSVTEMTALASIALLVIGIGLLPRKATAGSLM